jgi:hypothetical protein
MGHKEKFGYSAWTGSSLTTDETKAQQKAKKEALEEYNDPNATYYHNKKVTDHYNKDFPDAPITDEDQQQYESTGTWVPSGEGTLEGNATKQSAYEIELSKKREAERDAAKKKSEALLYGQPNLPISDATRGYVDMMLGTKGEDGKISAGIAQLLGNITQGGQSAHITQPYEIKDYGNYDVDQKYGGRGLDEFANMAGAARNQASILTSGYNKTTIPTSGYNQTNTQAVAGKQVPSDITEAMYSQWRLDQENRNRKKRGSTKKSTTDKT